MLSSSESITSHGVLPFALVTAASPHLSSSRRTMSVWPLESCGYHLWPATRCRGVSPETSAAAASAPPSTNIATTSGRHWFIAAMCSGVLILWLVALMSTPLSSSRATISGAAHPAASWSGVDPSLSLAITSSPVGLEQLECLGEILPACFVEHGVPVLIPGRRIRSPIQQQAYDLNVRCDGFEGIVQRRLLGTVRCIDVGTKFKQKFDHIHLRRILAVAADGLVQGSPSLFILHFWPRGVCTVFQQQPDNVDAAPHDSEMEGRETAGPGVAELAPCSSSNLTVVASGARNRVVESIGKARKSSCGTAFTSKPVPGRLLTLPHLMPTRK